MGLRPTPLDDAPAVPCHRRGDPLPGVPTPPEGSPVNALVDGLSALFEPTALLCLVIGLGLGLLVGVFPGITISMAVALATSFTLTLEPAQGLAMLLAIYVSAQYGDRIPSILVNTPGTPAAVATTLDGYPMARKGQAGLALSVSAIATTVGILMSMLVLVFLARPIADFALRFGPFEMFALVVFGLTVIISIASQSLAKGIFAGLLGIALGMVGLDPSPATPGSTSAPTNSRVA
nr:tripartite tricarboxylate transporter permease [Tessaracoccus coleopterorum]